MSCCQCQAIEQEFDKKYVEKELKRYRRKGPSNTTRMLLSANFFSRCFCRKFRTFIHPTTKVNALVRNKGLTQIYFRKAGIWQVVVYRRIESG